ncbi:hypothetical protein U0070_011222 [Myodes glareolus]|uniref:Uncharacterized protein n=1 Tax=Myodes glareolus TaxID=447135 RepID=A0AAW0H645_MYOGA
MSAFKTQPLPYQSTCAGLSSVPIESGNNLTSGVTEWLLGCLGPITMALIFCYWIKRKIG